MGNLIKGYPRTTIGGVVVLIFYIFLDILGGLDKLAGASSFFSSTPPLLWLKERWPAMTAELYWWLKLVIYLCMLGALTWILIIIRRQKQEREQIETIVGERNTAHRTIAKLQAKLSILESTQPYLKTESYRVKRKAGFGQSGAHQFRDHVGYFMLLRVTNEPTNLNSQAIAHHIYATISYCDNQGDEFFPSVHGGWFSLWQSHGSQTIGPPKPTPNSLDPHESTYLGIALSYESDPQLRLYALDKSSGEWSNWFNPDLALPKEIIHIKVIVGCDGFQRTYSYILGHHGTQLSPIDSSH